MLVHLSHYQYRSYHSHFLVQSLTLPWAAENLGEVCKCYPEMSKISETIEEQARRHKDRQRLSMALWWNSKPQSTILPLLCNCLLSVCALNSAATPHQTLALLICAPLLFEKEHSLQSLAAHAWLRPVTQLNKNSHWFLSYLPWCTKVNKLDSDYPIKSIYLVKWIHVALFLFKAVS